MFKNSKHVWWEAEKQMLDAQFLSICNGVSRNGLVFWPVHFLATETNIQCLFFFFFKKNENSFLFGLAGPVEDKKTLEWMCGPSEPQKPLSLFHMVWSESDGISDCGSDSRGWGNTPEWKRWTSKAGSQIQVKFIKRLAEAGRPLCELAWSPGLKWGQISNEPKMSYGFRCRSRGMVPAVFLFKLRVKIHRR